MASCEGVPSGPPQTEPPDPQHRIYSKDNDSKMFTMIIMPYLSNSFSLSHLQVVNNIRTCWDGIFKKEEREMTGLLALLNGPSSPLTSRVQDQKDEETPIPEIPHRKEIEHTSRSFTHYSIQWNLDLHYSTLIQS